MKVVEAVKVVLIAYNDQELIFDLVFADNCVKRISLDSYGIKAYRGLSLRSIIEHYADLYFESLERHNVDIHLIFL